MVPIQKPRSFHRSVDTHRSSNMSLDRAMLSPKSTKSHKDVMTIMLIGPKQKRFKVNKRLLCDSSPFFSERLEGSPQSKPISLWLPGESATMFALFVEWVHRGPEFRDYLAIAVAAAHEANEQACLAIHWAILRLHLFASHLSLHELQDLAMDAVQDLYLRCDWDVPPTLITYLYTKCEAVAAVRLRRWAVAMVAFSLTGNSSLSLTSQDSESPELHSFHHLLKNLPEFAADYAAHARKLRASGLDARFKNPQLRIPANKLRNEERAFGFRECSFHSHRASVGEHRCPHEVARAKLSLQATKEEDEEWDVQVDGTGGLTAPSRREKDAVPRPLFSRDGDGDAMTEDAYTKALKHVRSISSTLKA